LHKQRMNKRLSIPRYDFYKKLKPDVAFEYSRLEKAYNTYDASNAHRHDYFEILIFNESGGTHEIDFVIYPVKRNTIHFISPGQVHLLRRAKNVTGHVLAFKEEIFLHNSPPLSDIGILRNSFHSILSLKKNERKIIDNRLTELLDEYSSIEPLSMQAVSAHLILFLIDIMRIKNKFPENRKNSSSEKIYNSLISLLENNFLLKHSVSEYASMINITAGHLNDSIKNASGKSASQVIHDRIILEAKRMLFHSDKSIKEIANYLGFEDSSYFIKFFKTHTRETPAGFRTLERGSKIF
jgi:AraC family transcriptional activator of pobA